MNKTLKLQVENYLGNSISIEPDNYPDIIEALEEKKKESVKAQRTQEALSISQIISKLRQEIRHVTYQRGPVPQNVLQELTEEIFQKGDLSIVKSDQIHDLMKYCRMKINELVCQKDLYLAQGYQDLNDQLYNLLMQRTKTEKSNNILGSNQDQLARAQDTYEIHLLEFQNALHNLDEKEAQTLREFDRQSEQQLREFDAETMKGPPSSFMKYSNKYLILKLKERSLVNQRKFLAAAEVREEREKSIEEEANWIKEKFFENRTNLRTTLVKDLETRRLVLQRRLELWRQEAVIHHESILESDKKVIENVNFKINHYSPLMSPIKGTRKSQTFRVSSNRAYSVITPRKMILIK